MRLVMKKKVVVNLKKKLEETEVRYCCCGINGTI